MYDLGGMSSDSSGEIDGYTALRREDIYLLVGVPVFASMPLIVTTQG